MAALFSRSLRLVAPKDEVMDLPDFLESQGAHAVAGNLARETVSEPLAPPFQEGQFETTPCMEQTLQLLEKVATTNAPTVLIEGESGTGKNALARLLHQKSHRAEHPFIEINCAALPETLIESELFGHEKGSFTGADHLKRGLFEAARGGTIFLDEICETSSSTQAKLLQVIEGRVFRRIGGTAILDADVRVIAASSSNLKEAVGKRRFREDLYYRLQLVPITVPPLRARLEDIPVLARFFVRKFNHQYKKNIQALTPQAEALLKTYSWPGNVRELENMIERIAILENNSHIDVIHLPNELKSAEAEPELDYQVTGKGMKPEEYELKMILQAVQKTFGNRTRAARLLGMTPLALQDRMEKFGLLV